MGQDLRARADAWTNKRLRLQRTMRTSAVLTLAVGTVALWQLLNGTDTRWLPLLLLGGAGVLALFLSMMAYANTTLVAMYFDAVRTLAEAPEELDLVTGTIEAVERLQMPYIGAVAQVTLSVADQSVRYYCPSKLLVGLRQQDRVRFYTHDLFAIRTEAVVQVPDTDVSAS